MFPCIINFLVLLSLFIALFHCEEVAQVHRLTVSNLHLTWPLLYSFTMTNFCLSSSMAASFSPTLQPVQQNVIYGFLR